MDLLDVLPVLRRRWLVLVGSLLTVLVLAMGYLVATPETYRASAQVFVATATADDAAGLAQANAFALTRVRSYVDLVASPEVTAPVIEELGLATTPEALAARIEASVPLNTVLIDIAVSAGTAEEAATVTGAVAEQFVAYVDRLEQAESSADGGEAASPVALTVIHPARVPDAPVAPKPTLTLVLAVLAGLVGGAVLAVARDRLDTRVRAEADLGPAAPPVLGVLERTGRGEADVVALRQDPHGPRAEALRHLRTNLEFLYRDGGIRTLAVVSPSPGDGRTTLALDLAVMLAESGRSTILVDAALRRPGVADRLGLESERGLADALVADDPVAALLVEAPEGLRVLPAGHAVPNPGEVLASDRMRRLLAELAGMADIVVVDTSPLLESADTTTLVAGVDATLLLVRSGRTRRSAVQQALERLERVQRPAVGVVLAGVKRSEGGYGQYSRAYRPAVGDASSSVR